MLSPEQIEQYRSQYNLSSGQTTSDTGEPNSFQSAYTGLKTLYGGGEQGIAQKLKRDVVEGAQDIQSGKVIKGIAKAGLRTAGDIASTVYAPVGAALEATGVNKVFDKVGELSQKGGRFNPLNRITDIPSVQRFVSNRPNVEEDFGRSMAIFLGTMDKGQINPRTAFSRTANQASQALNANTGLIGGAKSFLRGTGRALKATGEKTYEITVPPSEGTSKALLGYQANQPNFLSRVANMLRGEEEGKPTTEANTAARQGLFGTERELSVQSKRISQKLWTDVIEPKLDKIKGKFNFGNFLSKIEEKIISENPDLTRRASLLKALESVKDTYKKVGNISLKKLQEYKEGWAKFLPETYYGGKEITGARRAVDAMMASYAREIIYRYIGKGGQQAYWDYGNLQNIIESGIKAATRDPAKTSISRGLWSFAMDKVVTPVATIAGKVLYRTGEGLEFIGEPGAKKVGDIFNLPVQTLNPTPRKVPFSIGDRNVPIQSMSPKPTRVPLYGGQTPPRMMGGETTPPMKTIDFGETPKKSSPTIETETPKSELVAKVSKELYGIGAVNKNRIADIVLGLPASGKNEIFSDKLVSQRGSLLIDADLAKPKLPGYDSGKGAAKVHNLSSDIVEKSLLKKAAIQGDNIVMPLVGKNEAKIQGIIDYLNGKGYKVNLHLSEISPETSLARAAKRGAETGREVGAEYIQSLGNTPSLTYKNIVENPANRTKLNEINYFSNEVSKGFSPKVIDSSAPTFVLVSPNTKVGLTYDAAIKNIKSKTHQAFKTYVQGLANESKLSATILDALGKWLDGAEDTLVFIDGNAPIESLRVLGSKAAKIRSQKQFIWFKSGVGDDFMHEISFQNVKPRLVSDVLTKHGIVFQTVSKNIIYVFNKSGDFFDSTLFQKISRARKELGKDKVKTRVYHGTGDFEGSWLETEAARQEAKGIYDEIIKNNGKKVSN